MNSTNKFIIYYFSGTGNSKNVAHWLAEEAKTKDMQVELINIANIDRKNIKQASPNAIISFVSPVHGFNYPPAMLHFIFRFPKGKNSILLLNTRAGMLVGKFITPGLSGISLYLSAFILLIKGFSIKGMFPVDLPSNWISIHPGLNKKTVDYLYEKNKQRVSEFAQRILSGRTDFRSCKEIIQDSLIAPIAIAYYFIGRFIIAKTFYASRDCDNCGLCSRTCPVQAIKTIDNRPYWTFNCESCMHCMCYCPKRAIESAHGIIVAIILIFNIVIMSFISQQFEINNQWLEFALESVLFLVAIGLWYRIFHYLLRYKWFERAIVYTSLTKLKFWRRYRGKKA